MLFQRNQKYSSNSLLLRLFKINHNRRLLDEFYRIMRGRIEVPVTVEKKKKKRRMASGRTMQLGERGLPSVHFPHGTI